MKVKPKLGYEPLGVDLLPIQSAPLTAEEKQELSAYVAQRKKLHAAREKAAATRRITAGYKKQAA